MDKERRKQGIDDLRKLRKILPRFFWYPLLAVLFTVAVFGRILVYLLYINLELRREAKEAPKLPSSP